MKLILAVSLKVTAIIALGAFLTVGCTRTESFIAPTPATATPTITSTPGIAAPTATFTPGFPQNPWVMFNGTTNFSWGQFQIWVSAPGQSANQQVTPNFSDSSEQWYNPTTGLYENSMSLDVVNYGTQGWLNIDMTTATGGAGGGAIDYSAGNYTTVSFYIMGTDPAGAYPLTVEINVLSPGFDTACNDFVNVTPTWQHVTKCLIDQYEVKQMIFFNLSNNNPQSPPYEIYLAHITVQ